MHVALACGPANIRGRERVRRYVHVPRAAAALAGRGGALPVPAGGVWGRSSNVFLRNGARLYLDVGSHPEYATPECDNVLDLVAHDKAGERILEGLLVDADRRLREEGIAGDIYLFKNNTDSAGNSYGCHENYLVGRHGEFGGWPTSSSRSWSPGRSSAARARCCRRRGARCTASASAPSTSGRACPRRPPGPADHQHQGRAARRCRAVPAAARDRRRLQHERDHDAAQGRLHRPGAADDRGRRDHAGPDPGQRDPGHPRGQPRHDRPQPGPARQRARASRPGHPVRVPEPGQGLHRQERRWTRSASGCSRCGSGRCARSRPGTWT